MKKFVSLVIATVMSMSVVVSFATVASAATEPRVEISAIEVDFTSPEYSAYANSAVDWREYEEEGLAFKTYDVQFKFTGLEMETTTKKVGRTTVYTGDSITGATLNALINSGDLKYNFDWVAMEKSHLITGASVDINASSFSTGVAGTTATYPAPSTVQTVTASEKTPAILSVLVTIDASKSITITLDNAILVIGTFDDLSSTPTTDTIYSKDRGTIPVSGVSLTLPLATTPDPVVEEPGIAPAEEVEAEAIGTVEGYYDIGGNAVTSFSENYGITKFSTALDTANKKYYLYITDTNNESNMELAEGVPTNESAAAPFLIDFDAEKIETSGTVQFFALVHSTEHVIKSIRLLEVAK